MRKDLNEKSQSEWVFLKRLPKTVYMGIDCSSKAIHAVLIDANDKVIGYGKWGSNAKDFSTRHIEISRIFSHDLSRITNRDLKVAIEAAIYIQNAASTIAIASVVASARVLLDQHQIDSVLCDNRHWKKLIIGKGNCNKEMIREYTITKWGDIFAEQDWCDASCLALYIKTSTGE